MTMGSCTYTLTNRDGYGDDWRSACGHELRIESPIEVGFSFASKPNDHGQTFCSWCGKRIALKEKK